MYNIFNNIKVEPARTDSSAGQFRFEVKLLKPFKDGKHSLVVDREYVIDTTEDLSECLDVARDMVARANGK